MKRILPALIVLLLASFPARTHALGIRLFPQDPEAVSRGSAFAATADNASAIYYNPAGITQLQGQSALFSSYGLIYDVNYNGSHGSASTSDKAAFTGQFYYTLSIKDTPLTFGLGVYEPYGLKSEWSDQSPLRTLATKNSLIYVTINPVLAWKISETFSIAAGLRVEPAQIDLRRGIFVRGDQFKFSGDGTAVGFNAGLLWKPHPMHSFGVNYFSETSINFDGTVSIDSKTPFFFPSSSEGGKFNLNFPQHVVFGYSFRPTEDWNFEFNLDWTDWNHVTTTSLNTRSGSTTLPFDWKSGFTYEFGVKRRINEHLSISGGYLYSQNSIPDATFNPAVPDMNLNVFSVGSVYEWSRWRLALTYQFGYGTRNVSGSPSSLIGQNADGHYRWISNALMLGAGVKF